MIQDLKLALCMGLHNALVVGSGALIVAIVQSAMGGGLMDVKRNARAMAMTFGIYAAVAGVSSMINSYFQLTARLGLDQLCISIFLPNDTQASTLLGNYQEPAATTTKPASV